jgi:hypothetical protein
MLNPLKFQPRLLQKMWGGRNHPLSCLAVRLFPDRFRSATIVPMNPAGHVPPYELPDDKLVAQCRFEAFTASGPGGQKRNRTYAAVRITHLPTGISATATDSRSQRENRTHALRALRCKLAMELQRDIALDPLAYRPPAWFSQYPRLHISPKNPLYPAAIATVLDVLKATHWQVPAAASLLELSSSALTRFLRDDGHLWAAVNHKRAELGMPPLRAREG